MASNILNRIIEHKKSEIAEGRYHCDTSQLQPSQRSLIHSITNNPPGFILECKSASPSKGIIIQHYDPIELSSIYEPFAAAISVLTDRKFFNGELEHLRAVSETIELPVLCKDFMISEQQVLAARYYGADAILLMLSVLNDEQYLQLAQLASSLQLDILTEVHTEAELKRALSLDAEIIGINNRDLTTLSIHLDTTLKLLPQIPPAKVVISESGIQSFHTISLFKNQPRAANGFLIGSHLGAAKQTRLALRSLRYSAIKICGLTRHDDALKAYELGASYGGLIFASDSPRKVSLEQAAEVKNNIPLRWVGVFTETTLENIHYAQQRLSLDAVQLHWDAQTDFINQLRCKLPEDCEIWKREKVVDDEFNSKMDVNVDRLLLEPEGKLAGGNGNQFNWQHSQSLQKSERLDNMILAGGIGPENICRARKIGVGILDVNSAVESIAGVKDHLLLQQLFKQLESFDD